MKVYMKVLWCCMAIVIAGLMCGTSFADSKELAKVDDVVITDSDLKQKAELLPERSRQMVNKEKLLNKMIDEELLIREAQRLNLHEKEEYKYKVENYKRDLLTEFYLQQYLNERNTEDNQRKYFEEHKENYKSPDLVKISVIRVKSEEEAQDILKKLQGGEDFAELAKKYSLGPLAQKGGDFGFRARKTLRKELGDAAFAMKKGDLNGPVKAEDGYYIIRLTDRREEGIAKFEDVKTRVSSDYVRKLIEDRILELRKAAKIQINTAELNNLNIGTGKGGEK